MSLWSRLFGKKPSASRDLRDNSEDWKVGDYAICIDGHWRRVGPREGCSYRVVEVREGPVSHGPDTGSPCYALVFAEFGLLDGWWTQAFRKPRANESEAREAWQEMLRNPQRIKRKETSQ